MDIAAERKEAARARGFVYRKLPRVILMMKRNRGQRQRRVEQATPPWVDRKELRAFRRACPPGFHVDHIVALKGRTAEGWPVSGLHVLWNLQYLPARANLVKGAHV
jgi:hypothetical protein